MEVTQSAEDESQDISNTLLNDLNIRLEKYLTVLKSAEAEGNQSKVRRYNRIVKQYTDAIKCHQSGKAAPLEELPNPPGFEPLVKDVLTIPGAEQQVTPRASPVAPRRMDVSPRPQKKLEVSPGPINKVSPLPVPARRTDNTNALKPSINSGGTSNSSGSIPILVNDLVLGDQLNPTTDDPHILEDLTSRLEVYKSVLKSAENEENSTKARRYSRIIKQYADAITLHKAGKIVALEELPNPPGFPPLVPPKSDPPSPIPPRAGPFPQGSSTLGAESDTNNAEPANDVSPSQSSKSLTRAEKQTFVLKERQKEYRDAALAAKKAGQIAEAKEYLKFCKGFDRLIQASEGGLPVDLTTIPVSLKAKQDVDDTFHLVTQQDCIEGNDYEVYEMLEKELTEQIKMCMVTRNNFKMTGDIANSNRFEQYALHFKKDLNNIRVRKSNNYPVPKFHYENKSFSTIQCNSDLTDAELELTIMQGINYKVSNPNDVDTYVTYEFPYPQESPKTGRTSLIKNTNNPEYDAKYVFPIHREVRACQRIFKRHGIKLEVWSKGGFFHSDSLLGTVIVKLMPLNTDITVHEAFDLMNGRRPSGGKLEVKVRVREPLFAKKVDTVTEKWLIIDYQ